jgi:hypothetical protein
VNAAIAIARTFVRILIDRLTIGFVNLRGDIGLQLQAKCYVKSSVRLVQKADKQFKHGLSSTVIFNRNTCLNSTLDKSYENCID